MKVALQSSQSEVDGIWVTYSEGVEFLIGRAGNANFLRASDRLEAPHRKQIRLGKLSTMKQIEIQCRAMAEAILLDWKGIDSSDGPLEYNVENAYSVLRYNIDVRDFVFEYATENENFREEEIEATAKKSKKS